jgi:predicted branched-subunit amino acid permease
MSAVVLTGSAQFLAVQLIGAGAQVPQMWSLEFTLAALWIVQALGI